MKGASAAIAEWLVIDKALPRECRRIDREALYRIARDQMEEATLRHECYRDQLRAQREAIFLTLEDFNLIERTRGDGQEGLAKRK